MFLRCVFQHKTRIVRQSKTPSGANVKERYSRRQFASQMCPPTGATLLGEQTLWAAVPAQELPSSRSQLLGHMKCLNEPASATITAERLVVRAHRKPDSGGRHFMLTSLIMGSSCICRLAAILVLKLGSTASTGTLRPGGTDGSNRCARLGEVRE